jgi:23S rRNA (cytidine2498-2'-O)-methyltransferase
MLARDPLVHHVRSTSGQFLRSTSRSFAVVVNDMRMPPELSARTMLEAARRMRPGGLAVTTLKTGSDHPVSTVRHCVELLRGAFRVEHVRQLHHNRQEVTVLARRS